MRAFPSNRVPFVDERRLITEPWQLYIAPELPGPVAPVAPSGSPFAYQAGESGTAYVVGGTVSAIHILRGTADVDTGMTSGSFALGQGDILVVTYSVLPTMHFLPA